MRITTKKIKSLNPCETRLNNYLKYYSNFRGALEDFILLENITYEDKVWVVTRLFTKEQNVKWSLLCASKVLPIYEAAYSDKRPRRALEACEAFINDPSPKNKNAADAAAYAASYAAYAAYAAADAAAYAADSRELEETVNLLLMVECL